MLDFREGKELSWGEGPEARVARVPRIAERSMGDTLMAQDSGYLPINA